MTSYPGTRIVRRETPDARVYEADICVVGSGAAGLSAALEAARLGRTVVLVDAAAHIGGQAVGSAIGTICGLYSNGPGAARLTHGVVDDLLGSLIASGNARPRFARNTVIVEYAINAWLRWAETRVAQAGIVPLMGSVARGATVEGGRVRALSLANRFGDATVRAGVFVDASGDAVVPWLAGADLRVSEESVWGTAMAIVEGVDTEVCKDYPRERFHRAIRDHGGDHGLVRQEGAIFPVLEAGKMLFNLTHVETPLDPVGLTRATIEGHRQIDGVLAVFKRAFPDAFAQARVAIYGQAGIRQTRTIVGREQICAEAVIAGREPADAVVRTSWPIELHTRPETTHWEVFGDDHMHYVPFGAMTPAGLDNVVAAGRCIDAEPAALASVRVMGPCMAMGRAAAEAAAMLDGGSVHQIDVEALKDRLADNLKGATRDPWLDDVVGETGPERVG